MRRAHHNLPMHGPALVGRDQDVARLSRTVLGGDGHLVTLTGVGGCGKTRLAFTVASKLGPSFKDGVWLVELAPLADPLLVTHAVASVLGVREGPERSLLDVLVAHLAHRNLLLVLDNCEHLANVCAELADTLLRRCPTLRLLATSREPLRVSGEVAWRVPSLVVPDPSSILTGDDLVRYPATQLFVERAQAVQSDFVVTPRSAPVVATICARLEGLPLAIELAAAWVRALGVEQILERLDNLFGLLVSGNRSAPGRQRTMRATLDWSYGLLDESERVIFRRLAVFAAGWSLEAAEVICSGTGIEPRDVLILLTRLVDASLVQVDERAGRARYRLLEPVRQYARELLETSELDAIRRQHATFFLSFAAQWETEANVGGPRRQAAHAVLEREQDNLRAALRWSLDQGDAQMGLQLGRAHWNLWVVRGRFTEGRAWLAQLAALPEAEKAPDMRAVVQSIAASLAWRQGSYDVAQEIYREVLPLLRQANDPWLLHNALADLGYIALHQGDYPAAQARLDEALVAARATTDRATEALALYNLGTLAGMQEEYPTARAWGEKSLALSRAGRDVWAESLALGNLGRVAMRQGDLATAKLLVDESIVLRRQIGDSLGLSGGLEVKGQVATLEGQYADARASLHESLGLRQDLGDRSSIAGSLESIAALAAAEAYPARAIQLAGAATVIREAIGAQVSPMGRAMLDHWLVPLRQILGTEATALAWQAGRDMSVEQAVDLALAATEPPASRSNRAPGHSLQHEVMVLSPREQEVASLLVHGLTNRQIAERLVITERTVAAHIEHILDKLSFASRHQVGAWAIERGLAG